MDPKTSELVSNLKKLNLLNSEQEMITEEILEQFEDIIDWNAVQLNSLENVNMDKLTTWLLINAFILKQCCNPHNINIQEKLITAIKTFEQKDTQLVTELLDMDMAFLIFKREWKPPMALITRDQTWGNGKIKYQKILRSPITKEMAETLCMMDDIGANIVIPTWYYLMKKGQKRNLNEEIINELHTKITKPGKVYMTTNTNNGERKINIFIRDPEDYDDLKRNKFTIELSSMTLVFSSQAKYNECNNCGKVYSGFHPCSS